WYRSFPEPPGPGRGACGTGASGARDPRRRACSPSGCPLAQGVELGKERLRIEHDAVADQAYRTLNDPRGNLVQHELPGAGVDRVACVRAALIAHDEIGALGEHVDDLPFALVAPLRADDHDAVGLRSEHRPSPPSKNAPESGRWSILRRKL